MLMRSQHLKCGRVPQILWPISCGRYRPVADIDFCCGRYGLLCGRYRCNSETTNSYMAPYTFKFVAIHNYILTVVSLCVAEQLSLSRLVAPQQHCCSFTCVYLKRSFLCHRSRRLLICSGVTMVAYTPRYSSVRRAGVDRGAGRATSVFNRPVAIIRLR